MSRRADIAFACACAAFAAACGWLANSRLIPDHVGYWHWWQYPLEPHWTPLLLGALAALGLAAWLARTRPAAGLALGSIALAFALHLFMGRHFPMQVLTHYVTEAVNPAQSLRLALVDYEAAVAASFNPLFLDTKPPGLLVLHALPHATIASLVDDVVMQWLLGGGLWWIVFHAAGAAIIAVLWRVVPREEKGDAAAWLAAGLWAASPSVVLLDMEFSTRLYPLLALGLWAVFRREDVTLAESAAMGAAWALMVWTGFSAGIMAIVPAVFLAARAAKDINRALLLGMAFAAPVIVLHGALWAAVGYDPTARMAKAFAAHRAEFGIDAMPAAMKLKMTLQAAAELLLSTGVLAVAFLWGLLRKRPGVDEWATIALLVAMPLAGNLVSESARLWAFATPLMAVIAARAGVGPRAAAVAIAAQVALNLLFLPVQFWTYGKNM